MAGITKNPIFTDEAAARAYLENLRWPNGIVCLHCGAYGDAISAVQKTAKRRKPTSEGKRYKPARGGRYYCKDCEGTFTVTVGTVMEDSHILPDAVLKEGDQLAPAPPHPGRQLQNRVVHVASHQGSAAQWLPCPADDRADLRSRRDLHRSQEGVAKGKHGYHHKSAVLTLIDGKTGEAQLPHR